MRNVRIVTKRLVLFSYSMKYISKISEFIVLILNKIYSVLPIHLETLPTAARKR